LSLSELLFIFIFVEIVCVYLCSLCLSVVVIGPSCCVCDWLEMSQSGEKESVC